MTGRYQPGSPPVGPNALPVWLSDELRRISNAIGALEYFQLTPIDVEPAKPSKGMLVWAVGANWNPGAGEGMYVYNESGTWDKVN